MKRLLSVLLLCHITISFLWAQPCLLYTSTVDGNSSDMKMNIDKKGNVNCSFSVQGIGISAQVFINMSSGNNNASVSISPNFNNNNLTLNGNIVPLDQSNIFKGRAW